YKCVRTPNGFPGTAACVGKDGQHFRHGIYKPPRWSALPVVVPLRGGSHPCPQSSSYSRPPQLRGKPVIEGRPSSSRLVSTPSGDRADLAAFLQGPGGSVCQQTEHLLPSLVLARGRQPPTGHRRAEPPVAEPASICVSPGAAPPASAGQGSGRGQGIVIDSPPLAQPAVGSGCDQYVRATALGAASAE